MVSRHLLDLQKALFDLSFSGLLQRPLQALPSLIRLPPRFPLPPTVDVQFPARSSDRPTQHPGKLPRPRIHPGGVSKQTESILHGRRRGWFAQEQRSDPPAALHSRGVPVADPGRRLPRPTRLEHHRRQNAGHGGEDVRRCFPFVAGAAERNPRGVPGFGQR